MNSFTGEKINAYSGKIEPTGECCDICGQKISKPPDSEQSSPVAEPADRASMDQHTPPSDSPLDTVAHRDNERGAVKRRDQHLEEARKLLLRWRRSTYHSAYPYAIWAEEGLMPDVVVTALATYRRWRTPEDLQFAAAEWMWRDRHADEVLKLLKDLDERVDAEKEVAKREKADARKAETKKRREAKKRARERESSSSSSSSSDEETPLALTERVSKRLRVSRSHEATRPSTPLSSSSSPLPLTVPLSATLATADDSVCSILSAYPYYIFCADLSMFYAGTQHACGSVISGFIGFHIQCTGVLKPVASDAGSVFGRS